MPTLIKFAITHQEIVACHPVLAELRPHLPLHDFATTVERLSGSTGFKLAYLSDGDVKAVAGCRTAEWLHSGKYMEIEDLVTASAARSKGYGAQLFHWLVAEARREECRQLRLVSGVQRADAHRFYERLGMVYEAKYFSLNLR